MAHKVFICHSSKDKAIADAACAALEAQRIPCWIAPRDILAGEEYGKSIVDALASCQIVLLVFSAHANDSPQVRREIERAVSKGKIIVPFRIEDVLPSDAMEFALSNTHWLDALTPPMERYLIQLCDTIVRLIQKHAVAEAPLWRPPEPVVEEPIVEPKPIPVQASVIERVAAAEPSMNSEPIKERTTSSPRIPSEETGKRAEPVTEGVKAAPKPTVEPTPETVDLRTAEAEIEESKSGWRRLPGWAWGVLAVVISVAVMAAWQLFGPPFFSPKMNHDARLYDQACGGGDAGACDDLGNLYMGHNHSKSAAFFTKACDGGDALGCSSLGDLYLDGVGVAQDSPKAITLFSKACDGGNVNGCNVAGYIYRIGLGVAKDPEKERQFLTKGCKIGVQSSCDQLKEMQ